MLSDLLPVIVAIIAICFMALQIKTNILPISEGNDKMRTILKKELWHLYLVSINMLLSL